MDIFDINDLPFPQSLLEFQRLVPDEIACAGYLERARWIGGFTCPACQEIAELSSNRHQSNIGYYF